MFVDFAAVSEHEKIHVRVESEIHGFAVSWCDNCTRRCLRVPVTDEPVPTIIMPVVEPEAY